MSSVTLEEPFMPEIITRPVPQPDMPEWFQSARCEAWNRFEKLAWPKRTDESWRFTDLKKIDIAGAKRAEEVAEAAELISRSTSLEAVSGRMIFANDRMVHHSILSDELRAKGMIWESLGIAVREHAEIVRRHFMTQPVLLGGDKFAALHQANVTNGTFLFIPKNTEISLPIEVFHWMSGDNVAVFPHTLIVVGENSRVTLVDHFLGASSKTSGVACGVNDLFLETGAKLTYVNVQGWSENTKAFQMNSTVVGRDAASTSLTLNLGAAYARGESVSHLAGQGGRSDMLSVNVTNGRQEIDQRTFQIHEVPNTASDLLYKNSLDDQARTLFAGLIRVEPGAHKTDAYQKVRNLLLSDEAEANSAPGLEIEADDVRCTHGATSGQVEAEELFYLLARGIPMKQAQKLIVHGFLQEAIDRLGNEAIAKVLGERVSEKFAG